MLFVNAGPKAHGSAPLGVPTGERHKKGREAAEQAVVPQRSVRRWPGLCVKGVKIRGSKFVPSLDRLVSS